MPAFRDRYGECPGSPGTGHHAAIGGLLQHTCEVLAIARQIAKVARADEELVIAGVLLHDIGKLESYRWDTGVFEVTEPGRLIGHLVLGVNMLRDAIRTAPEPPCTDEEALILEHFILSHHGQLEFGSPVRPLTLEAEILHFADDASAKTAAIGDAYASHELFPTDARISSRKVWQLDNRWLMKLAPDFGRAQRETAEVRPAQAWSACGGPAAPSRCPAPEARLVVVMQGRTSLTTHDPTTHAGIPRCRSGQGKKAADRESDRPLLHVSACARGRNVDVGASSRNGSRTARSHGSPRRRIGEDGTCETPICTPS